MAATYTHGALLAASTTVPRRHPGASFGGLWSPSTLTPQLMALAVLASYAGQAATALAGWPLWAVVAATLVPWLPLVGSQLLALARSQPWLALLTLLTLTQVGHLGEHLTQMTQLHLLHLDKHHAHGIFGALDIEWVHFAWNTWVAVAIVALVAGGMRRNPWLWPTLLLAGWHEVEHVYILATYLTTSIPGTPGLLAAEGAIGGGLPLTRPDLHFIYNLAETAPLVAALAYQLRLTRRRSLPEPEPAGSPRAARVAEALLARISPPARQLPTPTGR